MENRECLEIVTLQVGPFSDLHMAGVLLALCQHLTEKGLSLREEVWTARQSKSSFSIHIFIRNKRSKWNRTSKRK